MTLNELQVGATVEWFTPRSVFDALGERFDVDVASPLAGPVPWVPADRFIDPSENGLTADWGAESFVWCNPPYGALVGSFCNRMRAHLGGGILLLPGRIETRAFHATAPYATGVCFIFNRLHFVRSDGFVGRAGYPSILIGFGERAARALERSALGWTVRPAPVVDTLWLDAVAV